jgi:hypothetical protein
VEQRKRIKVIGTQRKQIDPDLMAQIIIALGKRLWQTEHEVGTDHPTSRESGRSQEQT